MKGTRTGRDRARKVFFPMFPPFILVHSPLLGPFTWQPVADELQREGYKTIVPSLLPVLKRSSGFTDAIARQVKEAVDESPAVDPLILVAHSAAGAFLPLIASCLDRNIQAYIFVDARLPRKGASLADEDSLWERQERREMVQDGMLPPWSNWFGEAAMTEVIPDDHTRRRFLAELQPIPLGLFGEQISFPASWPDAPCGYVRLSDSYRPMAQEAAARGWSVMEVDAQHLHLLADPIDVTSLLLNVVGGLETG